MSQDEFPEEFLTLLKSITKKRPRLVIEHILQHGHVTTEELTLLYGYKHAPRAARDVREEGIPLVTTRVQNAEGRTIAAYRFADPATVHAGKLGGRKTFSKNLKSVLLEQQASQCAICHTEFEGRYFQIDHRIPFEVGGDPVEGVRDPAGYMLLCASCNRAKSWSCEHCANWFDLKVPNVCRTCYWARPKDYNHIALREIRRLEIVWAETEVADFERIKALVAESQESMPQYVKTVLKKHLEQG